MPLASSVLDVLAPACERIEIAGSLRRRAERVSDIEIVALPKARRVGLFGDDTECELTLAVAALVKTGMLRWRTETHPALPKDWRTPRRVWSLVAEGFPLDLFAVRKPAQYGAILAIRTGPADFSRRLVTDCRLRALRCVDGHLERETGEPVATPEERDFLRECGSPWVEPEARR